MLVALLVCLIPTTIGGLLSAIGVAGMDRMMQANVIATSGRAVEAAGDVDVLLLDKTGTITLGNRQASRFLPSPGSREHELADAAQLASLARRDARRHAASSCWPSRSSASRGRDIEPVECDVHSVLGADADERRRLSTAARCARAPPTRSQPCASDRGRHYPAEVRGAVEESRDAARTPLVVAEGRARARRRSS